MGAVYFAVTLMAKPSFALTAFGDVAQLSLAAMITAAFALQMVRAHGRVRSFWILMTAGVACWCLSQAIWSYFEVVLRVDVLNPSVQDIVLFLHLVPMMAALATLPHHPKKLPAVIPYTLGMLAAWWMYLYSYVVIPWQYVTPDFQRYGASFNTLYSLEDLAFVIGLAVLSLMSSGAWRTLYRRLLLGSFGYTMSAHFINAAIDQRRYYTGSLFDLPLIGSMICICWAVTSARTDAVVEEEPEELGISAGTEWMIRLAFFALLSVPVMATWSLEFGGAGDIVRNFRIVVSMIAVVILGSLLYMVQRALKEGLQQSLVRTNESLEKLAEAREALLHQASHDAMTGAMNRSAIVDALERELGRASRSDQGVAVLLVDLDHLKEINDRFGHAAGDVAIIAISSRMQDCVRSHDLVGRYGGDEFLVVIPESNYPTALHIAERMRSHLSATPVMWHSNEITLTASIGVAMSRPGDTAAQLLRRADVALYSGKTLSRNTIQVADPDVQMV